MPPQLELVRIRTGSRPSFLRRLGDSVTGNRSHVHVQVRRRKGEKEKRRDRDEARRENDKESQAGRLRRRAEDSWTECVVSSPFYTSNASNTV